MSAINVSTIDDTKPVQGQPTTASVRDNFAATKNQLSTAKAELEDLSGIVDPVTARANLGLVIGTNVQAYDATLQSLAALGTAADKLAYTTGVDTWAETPLTSFARTLLDDADAAAFFTTLGISAYIQALLNDADAATARSTLGAAASGANSDITSLSGLTTALSIAQGGTGQTTAAAAFAAIKQAASDIATGVVELATNAEVQTGTDTTRAVTPAGLSSRAATETLTGLVELATNAEAQAGTDTSRAITPATLRNGLNASGSAPIYAVRAWVNFNGTGTVTIRASGNVSSITDNGVGNYTVNFTTAMPDANYAAVASCEADASAVSTVAVGVNNVTPNRTTTTLGVSTFLAQTSTLNDYDDINVMVIR